MKSRISPEANRGRIIQLLCSLLFPAATLLFWVTKASSLLDVWSYWILAGIMAFFVAVAAFPWINDVSRLMSEGHMITIPALMLSYLLLGLLLGALVGESRWEMLLPLLAVLYLYAYAKPLLKKIPTQRIERLVSWSWILYSPIGALFSSIIFSLEYDILIIFSLGCLAGWYFDVPSKRLKHFPRVLFWLGVLGVSVVIIALDPTVFSTLNFKPVVYLSLTVMLHNKGNYLFLFKRTAQLETNDYEE